MNSSGAVGAVLQVAVIAAGTPYLLGLMRQIRSRLEGRRGPGVGQPWRDLRKLLGKQRIRPIGTTMVFRAAPAIVAASALVIAAMSPLVTTASPLDRAGDLFAVVGLLLIGSVALVLAGLDTGTPFGGMGASREVTIAALVEPSILMAVFALSVPVHSTNLAAIVTANANHPGLVVTPAAALAFAALVIVILAETGRLPVDNPTTHLELTMIHEAMVLEYAGPQLALVEWAAGMRLSVLLALLANLFVPFGIASGQDGVAMLVLALVVLAAKVLVLAAGVAVAEVFLAKLRLFRVPELLAGAFLLGLLAVTASSFLATPTG